jgi:hypothetical protein
MNNETTPIADTCTGEPPCSPLRSFFHGLAAVSANIINATPEEAKRLHECAEKCADEREANAPALGERSDTQKPVVGGTAFGMTCDGCRHLAPSGACRTFPKPGLPCNEFSAANSGITQSQEHA